MYKDEETGKTVYDFASLIKEDTNAEEIWMYVTPGKHDLTRWANIRKWFGTSAFRIFRTFGSERVETGTLKKFKPQEEMKAKKPFWIKVTPEVRKPKWHIICELAETEQYQKYLKDCDIEELTGIWRDRKSIYTFEGDAVEAQGMDLLFGELERRFEGFTRKVAPIKIPSGCGK